MLDFLVDVVGNLLFNLAGYAPERPRWLRRLVQTLWLVLGAALLAATAFGLYLLLRSLIGDL